MPNTTNFHSTIEAEWLEFREELAEIFPHEALDQLRVIFFSGAMAGVGKIIESMNRGAGGTPEDAEQVVKDIDTVYEELAQFGREFMAKYPGK